MNKCCEDVKRIKEIFHISEKNDNYVANLKEIRRIFEKHDKQIKEIEELSFNKLADAEYLRDEMSRIMGTYDAPIYDRGFAKCEIQYIDQVTRTCDNMCDFLGTLIRSDNELSIQDIQYLIEELKLRIKKKENRGGEDDCQENV